MYPQHYPAPCHHQAVAPRISSLGPLGYSTSGPEDPQVPAATPRAPLAFPNIRTSQPLMSVGGASCTTVTTTSHLPRVNEQFELESFNAKVTETRMGAKAQATSPKSTAVGFSIHRAASLLNF